MDPATFERIQHRAYQIWLDEGKPHGRDVEHWRQAEAEILGGDAATSREDGQKSVAEAGANAEILRQAEPLADPRTAPADPPPSGRPGEPPSNLETELDSTKKRTRGRKAAAGDEAAAAASKRRAETTPSRRKTGGS
jgi:Protein of unknown function (DUF2934)